MSVHEQSRRLTAPDIRARKGGEALVCLTSYHAHTARILDSYCDVILVRDSLGMVMHGLESTVPVTLDMMILQGNAVMRGSRRGRPRTVDRVGGKEVRRRRAGSPFSRAGPSLPDAKRHGSNRKIKQRPFWRGNGPRDPRLELVAAVGGLKTHAPLQTRVGIATGLVVVGDLIGSGASQEQAIVGETPNLAARLQGIAEPNEVVIAEDTRKLIGHLFELEDLGATDLKGIAGPVRCSVVLRPASVESRFDAFHAGGLTELVGREEEVELILRRWSKAKSGEGQVVLLSGEPGIGKSRLTAALMERLANEPHTRSRYFCSPQHTDSALYPIISQMERAAGFTHDDNTQAKLDKLDALLAKSLTPPQDAALLADMLSLPNDGRYPTLELDPQQRRQKTLEALTAQLEALAQAKPVLMIFEDVHWIDPTSLEAVGRTVDRLRTLGVLLIVTYRPEFEPPWIGRPYVTALTLNRLGEREITAMIDRVTGNKALPESIRQDIIERTDGVPLFVEEMTKAVLEAESEGASATDHRRRSIASIGGPGEPARIADGAA